MKYIIISQPKAGTFLLANLYKEFGLLQDNYKLLLETQILSWTDHNWHNFEDRDNVDVPFSYAVNTIKDNEFAMTHAEPSKQNKEVLSQFKKVLITRDYEDVLDSFSRFQNEKNVLHGVELPEERINTMLEWKTEDVFHLTFNQLLEKNIEQIDSLQNYLFGKIVCNSNVAITNALNNASPTRSSIRNKD